MSFTRHLLVDGSNVLQAWPDLRAQAKRDRDTARASLVRRLAAIHDVEQVRVTIVFDGRGPDLSVERPLQHLTFSVIHTPASLSADDVIEQLVGKAGDASQCFVATDDLAERQTISAAGASALHAADLAAWAKRADARQAAAIAAIRAATGQQWTQS